MENFLFLLQYFGTRIAISLGVFIIVLIGFGLIMVKYLRPTDDEEKDTGCIIVIVALFASLITFFAIL